MSKELTRFLLVGGSGTLINFAVLTLTYQHFGFPVVVASLISNETAMISNFFCHEHWTFSRECHGSRGGRFLRYQFVASGGILITTVLLTTFIHFGLHYLFANALAIGIAVSWNFLMSHHWAWRRLTDPMMDEAAA